MKTIELDDQTYRDLDRISGEMGLRLKLKESAMLVMLLLVLAVPATGVVVEQTVGPYTISFDLVDPSLKINSTACFWNATNNMGYIRIEQKSHQRETFYPNGGKLGCITIYCSNTGAPVLLSEYDGMKTVAKSYDIGYKKVGFTNTTLYKRLVDNDPNAAVFVANSPYGLGDNLYKVGYRYDINTQVSFIGKMDGFDTFLNTIHLTVKNSDANKKTQPSQPATDIIQKKIGIPARLKYSELVNVSAKEFAESINNNVSALEHDMDLANETHNYDAIVKDADLIGQQELILSKMIDALNMADLRHQSDELYTMTHHFGVPFAPLDKMGMEYWGMVRDARARVEERNADIAEKQRNEILAQQANTTSSVSSIPNHGFGNYTFDGKEKVRATVKKGTDVVHMMAMEELPTDYGYTKDSAQYTVTSTGNKIKGYIDYTLDGYVVVMQPRTSSLTKGEFMAILDTFHRID